MNLQLPSGTSMVSALKKRWPITLPVQIDQAQPAAIQFGADANNKGGLLKKLKALTLAGLGLSLLGTGSYMTSYTSISYNAQKMSLWSNAKFKFYAADGKGGFKEQWINFNLSRVKHQIAFKINEVLQDRPDLRKALDNLPGGIEIRLYESDSLESKGGKHVVGLASIEENDNTVDRILGGPNVKVSMSFATHFVEGNLELSSVGNDVIAHELTHILDFIEKRGDGFVLVGGDGFLPGWSEREKARFVAARNEEIPKIQRGFSPMDEYALENDKEFLAVLSETFFEKPQELKASNPVLYSMMSDFFDLDPASSPPWAITKGILGGDFTIDYLEKRQPNGKYYIWGGYALVLGAGGLWLAGRKRKPKLADQLKELDLQYATNKLTLEEYVKARSALTLAQAEKADKKKKPAQ